jgi:sulfite reductase (NADPH) hemoprotein beta-component
MERDAMQAKVKTTGTAQPLVVTANRLRDGRVVWLADGGRWAERVAEAQVFAGEGVEAGLALGAEAERQQVIVGPYAAEVTVGATGPVPLRAREKFRADGPSIGAGVLAA